LPEVFQRKAKADRRGVAAGVPGVPPMIEICLKHGGDAEAIAESGLVRG
jgi:hypothetical protein